MEGEVHEPGSAFCVYFLSNTVFALLDIRSFGPCNESYQPSEPLLSWYINVTQQLQCTGLSSVAHPTQELCDGEVVALLDEVIGGFVIVRWV